MKLFIIILLTLPKGTSNKIFSNKFYWDGTLSLFLKWRNYMHLKTRSEKFYYLLKGESHIDFRTQSVIMTLGSWELSLMTFWNSEKLSNLKAHELSWTVNELCTRFLRVPSSYPPITHIHTGKLSEKIIVLQSLAPKYKQYKQQDNRN